MSTTTGQQLPDDAELVGPVVFQQLLGLLD